MCWLRLNCKNCRGLLCDEGSCEEQVHAAEKVIKLLWPSKEEVNNLARDLCSNYTPSLIAASTILHYAKPWWRWLKITSSFLAVLTLLLIEIDTFHSVLFRKFAYNNDINMVLIFSCLFWANCCVTIEHPIELHLRCIQTYTEALCLFSRSRLSMLFSKIWIALPFCTLFWSSCSSLLASSSGRTIGVAVDKGMLVLWTH